MTKKSKRALIAGKLRELLSGSIYSSDRALRKFARDKSIYEIYPLAAVEPADLEDLQKLILFAGNEGLSITPRGGGSGTAGGALGEGIIVALPPEKGFSLISGFRVENDMAEIRVGAGDVHEDLAEKALAHRRPHVRPRPQFNERRLSRRRGVPIRRVRAAHYSPRSFKTPSVYSAILS